MSRSKSAAKREANRERARRKGEKKKQKMEMAAVLRTIAGRARDLDDVIDGDTDCLWAEYPPWLAISYLVSKKGYSRADAELEITATSCIYRMTNGKVPIYIWIDYKDGFEQFLIYRIENETAKTHDSTSTFACPV